MFFQNCNPPMLEETAGFSNPSEVWKSYVDQCFYFSKYGRVSLSDFKRERTSTFFHYNKRKTAANQGDSMLKNIEQEKRYLSSFVQIELFLLLKAS